MDDGVSWELSVIIAGISLALGIRYCVIVDVVRLPALVVDRLLVQGLRDPLGDAPVDLSLHDHRIDDRADVVDGNVLQDLGRSGLRVDLDHADVRPGRPREVRRVIDGGCVQVWLRPLRQRVRVPGREGDLRDRLRLVGRARDVPRALAPFEVVLGNLELVGGDRPRLRPDLLHREVQGDASDRHRPRPVSVHPERRDGRVPVQNLDVVGRDAETVRHDLRPGRLVALTVWRRPGLHDHLPGRQALDRCAVPPAGRVPQRAEDVRGSEPAHLEVGREADPELLRIASISAVALFRAKLVVLDHGERLVQQRLVVPGVDAQAHDRCAGLVVGRLQVHAPDVGGILPDPPGEGIDDPLDHVRRLGPPGSPVGIRRRRVRHDAGELVPVRLGVEGAHVHPSAQLGDPRRQELVVRPHVAELHELQPEDLPVLGPRQRAIVEHAAAVDRRHVVLATPFDPLHGATDRSREREGERLLRVHVQLRTEAAAHVRCDHPQLVLRDADRPRERDLGDVRDLGRGHEGPLAHRRHAVREAPSRLDRVRDQSRLGVSLLDDHGCGLEDRLVSAAAVTPVDDDVRAQVVVDDHLILRRLLDVGHGGELRRRDRDRFGGIQSLFARLRNDDGHRVTVEPDLVRRQRVVDRHLDVLGDRPDEWQGSELEVARRVHADHARHRGGLGRIDAVDRGVHVGRTHHRHPHHPGHHPVVDVARLPREQLGIFLPQHGLADERLGRRHRGPPTSRRRPSSRPRRGSTSRCSGSRCSDRGCPRAPGGPRPPTGSGSPRGSSPRP